MLGPPLLFAQGSAHDPCPGVSRCSSLLISSKGGRGQCDPPLPSYAGWVGEDCPPLLCARKKGCKRPMNVVHYQTR